MTNKEVLYIFYKNLTENSENFSRFCINHARLRFFGTTMATI
ncbi:hypothetical protein [Nostoc sp. CENA543]|nr:hypothetical protein [Nostoc sp. CENA543]